MNLKQYVVDATTTESRIDEVVVNTDELNNLLSNFIVAGNALDKVKKNVFYGKEIKYDPNQPISTEGFTTNPNLLKTTTNIDPRHFHAIIGILTEATELAEALTESINENKQLDAVNIFEEIGDIMWYIAIAMDSMNGDLENILTTNIKKLKLRYPDKFTAKAAIDRDLKSERELLEQGLVNQED